MPLYGAMLPLRNSNNGSGGSGDDPLLARLRSSNSNSFDDGNGNGNGNGNGGRPGTRRGGDPSSGGSTSYSNNHSVAGEELERNYNRSPLHRKKTIQTGGTSSRTAAAMPSSGKSNNQFNSINTSAAGMGGGMGPEVKARIFLFVACLWPLWILALFGASSAGQQQQQQVGSDGQQVLGPNSVVNSGAGRLNLRKVMDRVDVMGYGPTHPRVAFVVVGDNSDEIQSSVENLYSNTDMNRIFLVCTVLDGHGEDTTLVKNLQSIDSGGVAHWHGDKPDIHGPGEQKEGEDENPHSKKIHSIFNPNKKGVAASRLAAFDFINVLQRKHEEAGLKSPNEDIILVLMEAGTKFQSSKWLGAVTSALIIPPTPLSSRNPDVPMKIANAVSFRIEGDGRRTSFDEKFGPLEIDASASDINLSSGRSYSTPALNGAAVALRLETFGNLPAQDTSLMDPWTANLELSLNLWLCGDGIDIIEDAEVTVPADRITGKEVGPDDGARFAATWMDLFFQQKFFLAYSSEITRLDWETKVAHVMQLPTIPKGLPKRCRSFEWYAQEINPNMEKVLEQGGWEAHHEDLEVKKLMQMMQKEKSKEDGKLEDEVVEEVVDPAQEEEQNKNKTKPAKPLRETNLNIVQKAKRVQLEFQDVAGLHEEHPHMGAQDFDGQWGYVHDVTSLRNNPPRWDFNEAKTKAACEKRDNNYKMMKERIVVDTEYDQQMKNTPNRPKIFCLVYTTSDNHYSRLPHIRQTWGPKCDGFMVGSNKTEPDIDAVNIPHEGPEEYNNIWQKVRSMWSYIYDNYYNDYDWFHIGGDDLFVIVENLREYVESEEIRTAANGGVYLPDGTEKFQTPLLLGRRFAYLGNMEEIFDSGGSGYTMNKAALKLLVTEAFPNYFPHAHTFSEDTMVAKLFRKFGVEPYDTKDDDGGERYMPFAPGHHYGYKLPPNPKESKDWYAKYSIDIKEGPEHCSPKSVAFHYIKDDMMERMFMLAYNMCPQTEAPSASPVAIVKKEEEKKQDDSSKQQQQQQQQKEEETKGPNDIDPAEE
mmetsp:Transcript_42166/g.101416  ORF Transcript_42166/g.101416 Transcript_42166/m.101416 type:complete len:1036 (-) Transcript_42166:81-3188(-)